MNRITVTGVDGKLGWFDLDTATRYDQGKRWDGNNYIGRITGSQWVDEYLYLTSGGRWVVNTNATRSHNGPNTYDYITAEKALEWLIRSGDNDDAIAEHFGDVEPERGPGRPAVGRPINWRPGDELLDQIDKVAAERGMSRADMLRELAELGLTHLPPSL